MSQFNVNDIEIASHLDDMRPSSTHAELRIGKGNTFVNVSPEMGGMVTRFQSSVRGQIQDLLHFEPFDFDHSGKKPKVGIPVLLPFAWPDPVVRQHGGLREIPWVWEDASASSITLSLRKSAIVDEKLLSELETKFWTELDFDYRIKISVAGEWILRYDISVKNLGNSSMPVAPWLHPYFRVDPERQSEIISNLQGFDLSNREWTPNEGSLILARQWNEVSWFDIPGLGRLTVRCDDAFDTFVIWSKRNGQWEKEPYLCIEPWIWGTRAIDDPAKRIEIGPGTTLNLFVEFQIS